jgi:uncharacterized protein
VDRVIAHCTAILIVAGLNPLAGQESQPRPRRIIDVHVHAYASDARWQRGVPNPITRQPLLATNEEGHRAATLDQMRRYGVVAAVVSAGGSEPIPLLQRWMASAPGLVIPAIAFEGPGEIDVEWIRGQHRAGTLRVIGEIGAPYAGYSPGNEAYERYFTLAEELGIPIAVHVGSMGGMATYNGSPRYRMELNRPLLLEDMLARHPGARVQMMHAGWPFTDEAVALMKLHPQVYADLGVIAWTQPRPEFYGHLRRLVEAGLGSRIMFGSDQMVWPEAIGMSIAAIEDAPFLTEAQKADIFCNNAARFLRLEPSPC